MPEAFVNLDNARSEEQLRVMKDISQNKECPFCPEHLAKYHKQPVIRQGDFWIVTYNQWPYKHTSLHLLAITKTHTQSLNDLPAGAGEELFEHMKWAEIEYRIAAGGLALRFGDMHDTGATVGHLHSHLIVPDANKPNDEKVRFKIS